MSINEGCLVLYKNRPARVKQVGEKLEIELEGNDTVKVRPKDVALLHPGPLQKLSDLPPHDGEVETAWEMLAGSTTTLAELAELVYVEYTPSTAWAAWQRVMEGLYFHGIPDEVVVHSEEKVTREKASREAKITEQQGWIAFVERVKAKQIIPSDDRYLREVVAFALERQPHSHLLQELGRAERPENAHALLLDLGYWDKTVDPYPQRLALVTTSPTFDLPDLPDEQRSDLTHLPAFAIDDEGCLDPDDALSLDSSAKGACRLWVHVADVAALVHPDDTADIEARAHGANLYLPEGTISMLPPKATHLLGLGLAEISPALSFGLDLDTNGQILDVEILPSWVRVTRLTYDEVELRLTEEPFQSLYRLAERFQQQRRDNGAIFIELPEVKIRVIDGQVVIRPLLPLRSRDLVTEAMLMAGQAVARFALEREIPFPFSTQTAVEIPPLKENSLAEMFAVRRMLKPSQMKSVPAPHGGLGLEGYVQTTSPLRRYLDMVVHQQLRAYLHGRPLLGTQELLERVGAAESIRSSARRAERLSRKHWTLIYLQQHPDWSGYGILVEKNGLRGIVLIPELDLETQLHLREDMPLDSQIFLTLKDVNLPELEAHFKISVGQFSLPNEVRQDA